MAAMNLNVPYVLRGLDSNADAESGSKLYVFAQGTTTPVTTYSDLEMLTANAHPVVADSSGSWGPIYLPYGTYKVDITDAGGTSLPGYPLDDVTGVPVAGFTATDISFDNSGTFLTSTTVQTAIAELDLRTVRLREVLTTGSANAYLLDGAGTITAYTDGMIFVFRASFNNTGAATLNVDSVGAKAIVAHDGSSYVALAADRIRTGNHYWVEYDSSADEFRIIFERWRLATQAEAEAGTATNLWMDPLRVAQAIAALETSGSGSTTATALASTSGTTVDFTSLPAGIDEFTVLFAGVSTNGTSDYLIRLGDAGGIETTGYTSSLLDGTSDIENTTGFLVANPTAATSTFSGGMTFYRYDGNSWAAHGNFGDADDDNGSCSGSKTLSAELTQVQVTSVTPDTFDAGTVGLVYKIY